jgi:hypothetical protein
MARRHRRPHPTSYVVRYPDGSLGALVDSEAAGCGVLEFHVDSSGELAELRVAQGLIGP